MAQRREGVMIVEDGPRPPLAGAGLNAIRCVAAQIQAGWLMGCPEVRREGELERQASAALSGKRVPKPSESTIMRTRHESDETFG